jgi:hypothetical protein
MFITMVDILLIFNCLKNLQTLKSALLILHHLQNSVGFSFEQAQILVNYKVTFLYIVVWYISRL